MKLHLGCGYIYLEGYVNIDKYAGRMKTDFQWDLNEPLPESEFKDNSVDEILAIHIVEHLHKRTLKAAIASWYRVLKPGGKLIMELPNFAEITKRYLGYVEKEELSMASTMLEYIFGNQENDGQFHFWGWTPTSLSLFLWDFEFRNIIPMEAQDSLHDKEISFRIEATKETE